MYPNRLHIVVLYLHSTSNHNVGWQQDYNPTVVLYLHSTSNHNYGTTEQQRTTLYYIFILHQTTTYTTYIADIQPFENHIGRYEVV